MTLEDPFFVVKDEVFKALNKTRGLYVRWTELQGDLARATNLSSTAAAAIAKEELDWTNTELKNSLRSIEWDLDDLDDTVDIVEKNLAKFKIDNKELTTRKHFINATREEVKNMKDKMNINRSRDRDRTVRQPLLENSPVRGSSSTAHATTKYSKLENELDSPQRQERILLAHDDQLRAIGESVGALKTVSTHIAFELDEQTEMLDEFGTELESTETKLESTMKRVANILHMSNDRRQWTAILLLSTVLLVMVVLFIYL